MNPVAPDPSDGALRYQCCGQCGKTWYFHRSFCPHCGSGSPHTLEASGAGRLYASTLVHRAPSEEFKPMVPYTIVLADMREGFRVMGHGAPDLPLDTPVRCEMRRLSGRLLPYFTKDLDAC